jgi:hypothetical protein
VANNINCAKACVNGCVLQDRCPHREHATKASKFISNTSLDKMLEMAEIARMKKLNAPPKWVIPEEV